MPYKYALYDKDNIMVIGVESVGDATRLVQYIQQRYCDNSSTWTLQPISGQFGDVWTYSLTNKRFIKQGE